MTEKQFNNGDVIFKQNEIGRTFFKVIKGGVSIIVDFGDDDACMLTEVGPGRYFGEMAILEYYPRSASAVAAEDGTVVEEMSEEDLNAFMENDPARMIEIMDFLGDRIRTLTADYNDVMNVLKEKNLDDEKPSAEFKGKLRRFLSSNKALEKSVDKVLSETGSLPSGKKHSEGFVKNTASFNKFTVICREGEPGDCMYDIHSGRVGIYTGYGTDQQKELTILYPDTFFGEMGMISSEPRSATAVALDDQTTIELIRREDLEELFTQNPSKADMIVRHLSYRLRELTRQYAQACAKVYEAAV